MEDARALAELIRSDGPCVVLSGAGMSTESGIPDFRSATGIWADLDPFEVASIDAFHRDPVRVWDFYRRRLDVLGSAQPNPGHVALAELEAAGHVTAVVTQNVDALHDDAGSTVVVEVHGSLREAVCLGCGACEPRERLTELSDATGVPRCASCQRPLKPGVVMFGELLPEAAIERAEALVDTARLLVVVGSSLQVWPVAGLPRRTLAAGGKLVVLNRDPTPYDDEAKLVLRGEAGATLAATRDILLDL